MKRIIICALLVSLAGLTHAQDITGSWIGVVPGGANLHLVFNITRNADSSYSATFDSPDQKVFGLPCSKAYRVKDSIFMEIAMINGGYKGVWDGKKNISGLYYQNGGKVRINLGYITPEEKANLGKDKVRPQTPKPPYGYFSEDVEYNNTDKTLHYGATFTRPNGAGKYPTVIIISGSGTQDRDGTMMKGHKPYWVLADYLTKNGIAVLRVDDRGAGKSSLGPDINKATSLDFSHDVEASLNYLESRPDVDKKHIGLIGHSEGGMIAPMVAARRKDVSFIVLWAGPGVTGAKILERQEYDGIKAAIPDPDAQAAYNTLNVQIMDAIGTALTQAALDTMISAYFKQWKSSQTPKVLSELYVNGDTFLGKNIYTSYNGIFNSAWLHYFIAYDPATNLSKVKCPVLALDGSKDTQVYAEQNLSAIKAILTKSGNKDFETIELPNLNHLFQDAKTGELSEYETIDETVSPAAMKIISDWIKLHTK